MVIQFQKNTMRYHTLIHMIFFLKKVLYQICIKNDRFKNRINIINYNQTLFIYLKSHLAYQKHFL
jgi:hypothetical protein